MHYQFSLFLLKENAINNCFTVNTNDNNMWLTIYPLLIDLFIHLLIHPSIHHTYIHSLRYYIYQSILPPGGIGGGGGGPPPVLIAGGGGIAFVGKGGVGGATLITVSMYSTGRFFLMRTSGL